MHDRDYETLFNYFIGARGEHAVHVRALIHAGFDLEADPESTRKTLVRNPANGEILGTVVGEPEAVIGKYHPPTPPKSEPKPAGRVSKSVHV